MSKRIVFFGNERLATGVSTTAPTLQALHTAGYDIAGVVVAQNQLGKSRKARELEIATAADAADIPLFALGNLRESVDKLKDLNADAAVLVAFGKIIPQEVIDIFPKGIINIHPSLLPKHRGPTPLESVILHGDKETGVSLMRLSKEMDAGPVYAQETVLLRGDETKQQLADQLLELGKNMLVHYLPAILGGKLKPTEQKNSEATVDHLVSKTDAELDFVNKSAARLAREVRAYAGWPRSRCIIGTTEVVITSAHVDESDGIPGTLWLKGTEFGIHAKKGVLVIDALIPVGKKEMSVQAFLAGYRP